MWGACGRAEFLAAIREDNVAALDALLTSAEDANRLDAEDISLLGWCGREKAAQCARLLVERGASVSAVHAAHNNRQPLHFAASAGTLFGWGGMCLGLFCSRPAGLTEALMRVQERWM